VDVNHSIVPIDDSEWRDGRTDRTIEAKIVGFLQREHPRAFNSEEIRTDVFGPDTRQVAVSELVGDGIDTELLRRRVDAALATLTSEGAVESKGIDEGGFVRTYYRAADEK